jgi:hypothetical protein
MRQVPAPNARADHARVERDRHRVVPTGPSTSTRMRRLVIRNLKQRSRSCGCTASPVPVVNSAALSVVPRLPIAIATLHACMAAPRGGPRNHAQGRAGGLGVGDAAEHGRAVLAGPAGGGHDHDSDGPTTGRRQAAGGSGRRPGRRRPARLEHAAAQASLRFRPASPGRGSGRSSNSESAAAGTARARLSEVKTEFLAAGPGADSLPISR